MAGGEFCGNAAMSAAVLFYVRTLMNQGDDGRRLIPAEAGPAAVGEVCMAEAGRADVSEGCMAEADSCARKTDGSESVEGYRAREAGLSVTEAGHPSQETGETDQEAGSYVRVMLKVSGASEPSEVRIYDDLSDAKDNRKGTEAGSLQKTATLKTEYRTSIRMPAAAAIHEETFSLSLPQGGSLTASLPVVDMEGISHIIVEEGSPFYSLCQDDEAAKKAIRSWQKQLGTDGLGLMFLEDHPSGMKLTPLVYIPGGDTMFWERSCASGSSAVGMYYAWRKGTPVELSLHEPGGCLKVASNPLNRETWLKGRVSIKADARTC
jgi:diaminopimelate epimerase